MKAQHSAVAGRIAAGIDPIQAYKEFYPKVVTDEAARVAVSRLMSRDDFKTELVTRQKEIVTAANTLAANDLKNDGRQFSILHMALKRDILHKIATGKMKTKTWDSKNKEYYFSYPSDDDKIKAMKLDAELTGEAWRPPEPENPGGAPINQTNTYIKRVTVFNTRITTSKAQEVQQTEKE